MRSTIDSGLFIHEGPIAQGFQLAIGPLFMGGCRVPPCAPHPWYPTFEQGLAQYLIKTQAYQSNNHPIGHNLDVLRIVASGTAWQFYRLTSPSGIYETLPYSIQDINAILGALHYIFSIREHT